MKETQVTTKKFGMPHCVYMQSLWAVRDYFRLKKQNDEEESKNMYDGRIAAIEEALKLVPEQYHKTILNNIIFRQDYIKDPCRSNVRRWKQRFLYYVANNIGINK